MVSNEEIKKGFDEIKELMDLVLASKDELLSEVSDKKKEEIFKEACHNATKMKNKLCSLFL